MRYTLTLLFFDPLLRCVGLGLLFMSIFSSIVGALAYLKRASLIGEALSHSCYPGVILGAMAFAYFSFSMTLAVFLGSFVFSLLGLAVNYYIQKIGGLRPDTALCFIVSFFLGLGVLLVSYLQQTDPVTYQSVQVYLYGQAATLREVHIVVYAGLSAVLLAIVIFYYRTAIMTFFDPAFAKSLGVRYFFVDIAYNCFLAIAVVVGIRSLGVVLMAGMLIAPPIASRQVTCQFSSFLLFSALFGALSSILGLWLSLQGPRALPTGPIILLVAVCLTLILLFTTPNRGLLPRLYRRLCFQFQCNIENAVKTLWKREKEQALVCHIHPVIGFALLLQGLAKQREKKWYLTEKGAKKARHLVRLHRLWEVYLVRHLGYSLNKVHCNAEEMEHIISQEMEASLDALLDYPKTDPHSRHIPRKEEGP